MQVFGSGSDEIVLKLAQDYCQEDARFTISIDGVQVGGIFTVSSLNGSGLSDTLTVRGNWGGGAHRVEINNLFDRRNAATGEDSNLSIQSATYNGAQFASPQTLYTMGRFHFSTDPASVVTGTSAADYLNGTRASDVLIGGRGNDAFWGGGGKDIYARTRGDGYDTITDFSVSGADADKVRLSGYMISSFADLAQRITQAGKDTVVRLGANEAVLLKNVTASTLTAANFEFVNPLAKKAAADLTAGSGKDTLVLKLSQDFFVGADAQYTVAVDGVQVGGGFSASAVRFSGVDDTLTIKGNWAAGQHVVTVNFLNDAFDSLTQEDRNLYLESATINGEAIAGVSKLIGYGSHSFAALVATAVIVTPAPDDGGGGSVPAPPTHEVFAYAKGDGARTIANFDVTGAGADTLKIGGYGLYNNVKLGAGSLDSFLDLKPMISQVGADTVIKLSGTDVITLENVAASTLTDDNFALVHKLEGAMQAATNNGWIVFNNTWGSGDFTYGKQYTVSSTYDSEQMATGTTFSWNYPAKAPYDYTKVLAYPSVMFGYDTFDNVQGDFDPAHVLPVQIDDLKSFKTNFNVTQGGDTGGFDTSFDIWLTKKPNGIWSDITNEVMIWLHRGEMSTYGDLVGTYSDGNYTAKIYHTGTYTALVPDRDYLAGDIDVKDVLLKLQQLGIVSDKEYVNQIDLGTEPFRGAGWMTINSLSYDLESIDEAGITTRCHADGGDTSIVKQGTAGRDTLSAGTAKIATLIGGGGNDTFVIKRGEINDLTIEDFHVLKASGEHDLLKFTGFGRGAQLVHDSGDNWSIHYQGNIDHFTLTGVQTLTTNDYTFG